MKSFTYYRQWHRENTNPAFIPWHTMAYCSIWKQTKAAELRDFVFEMNDFLVGYQETQPMFPDQLGRFWDTNRRHFGVPHASSTGVYLEGLIEAYLLAKAVKDIVRMKRYGKALFLGLRSILQLQMTDEVDMFYISKRDRVLGSIRTSVHHNEIRVDNIQHPLNAMITILATISEKEFAGWGKENP